VINEALSFLLILWILFKNKGKKFDIVNFHIAYPNCTYLNHIKRYIQIPVVITEHWSAYHFDFNIKNERKKKRIQKIFRQNTPVIAVSKALMEDIKSFSGSSFPGYIVPNVVNTDIFTYHKINAQPGIDRFSAICQWKWPKDPFTLLKAWKIILLKNQNINLLIGGYGPQWNEIIETAEFLGIQQSIKFKGKMEPEEIALEMNKSSAFIHLSEYETFSVVCAEALCCGTPIIASNVGGLKELINHKNGILVENDEYAVVDAVHRMLNINTAYNKKDICRKASHAFNEITTGNQYNDVIERIIQF
jgi:glycosyltransferase involved in cell wall biosynthesis